MAIVNQPIAGNWRWRFLRVSLRAMFVAVTLCCIGAWWWQRPFATETPIRLFARMLDGKPVYVEGRRVETLRRQGLGDPVKHGPTRTYDADGVLTFEEYWRNGVRHGVYRRWDGGELITELEFDRGKLVRVGETVVDDFLARSSFGDSQGIRIQDALQNDTSFEYLDQPLRDVIEDLSFRHDIRLQLDVRALQAADIAVDAPTTASLQKMPLFAALCVALAPLDLTCAYRYEQLWITTRDSGLFESDRTGVAGLSGEDGELAAILDQETTMVSRGQKLQDLLDAIAARHGVNIVNQAEHVNDAPTEFNMRGLALRSVLGALLYEHDLTGAARDDAIIVSKR